MINASPFYYGSAIVAYQPLVSMTSGLLTTVGAGDGYKVGLSQRPHFWIYPQNSQGGEMVLPFFYFKDWLRATNYAEFNDMGEIRIQSYAPLRNANSVVGSGCTVQVYAWAENLEVTGPTYNDALQSSKDEYSDDGPISKPASAIAAVAGKLETVPVIGPLATATKTAASAVGSIASLFGFTNAPVIEDVKPLKNVPFHGFASTEISAPVEKLTIDPKNEVSIDPRTVGLNNKDEMDISYIVQRESYLNSFLWQASDVDDQVLQIYNIRPEMIRVESTNWRQSTPPAHIQRMFKFWKGDLIYRFRIICSQYHRGRLCFIWDPDANANTLAATTTAFSRIVDITKEQDIELRIPYMQSRPWLQTTTTGNAQYFGAAGSYARDPFRDNGNLQIIVFTRQTSPVASAPIQILTYFKGAENLEFAAPVELPVDFSYGMNAVPPVPEALMATTRGPILVSEEEIDPLAEDSLSSLWTQPPPEDEHPWDEPGHDTLRETFLGEEMDSLPSNHSVVPSIPEEKEELVLGELQSSDWYSIYSQNLQSSTDTNIEEDDTKDVAVSSKTNPPANLVCMGEKISSIRQLMRRTCLSRINFSGNTAGARYVFYKSFFSRKPLFYGYWTNGINTTSTGAAFNYVHNTYYTYLAPLFVGQRGAHEWSINAYSIYPLSQVSISRHPYTIGIPAYRAIITIANAGLSGDQTVQALLTNSTNHASGVSLTNGQTQTGLTASAPMYTYTRFQNTNPLFGNLGSNLDGSEFDNLSYVGQHSFVGTTTDSAQAIQFSYFHRVGSDFSLYFFMNVPTIQIYAPPTGLPP